ncbi:MAG: glycine cleavage system protein H [Ferrovum sp. 37-45-19]|jgi:glycine cleavage system H protein|uniref:glycine cleavage system protein GcvH n=1 Tax=Ferrovum sp. JA12 TaxID=1356299 RepID=UPI00070356EF|nr:glycine cleavage system protein GcvH [Ferrovum sp. JA12]OYV79534.1 MAG: glycine cleavage system protein H [Ferrovum sp. 21-44-67]OYV94672.1 MAG: glycine cleavage system protein H [Ferrovum sp. 37-45-19]HQT81451.1 glycine cleavage system protein GcvH [Ferrovaceae bacterium]KRH79420.1 glycine cleavage system H protein [Ferrovum sp. JA12]HQU06338.1 glycine cleavage system protein GcvH [Ferrovaceae bacterium]
MSQLTQRRYSNTHQWASPVDQDTFLIGITDFAQQQLGDVMFVDLPQVGRVVSQAESSATVESVKSASDVYSPLSGTVIEVNSALIDQLEKINNDPYGSWLFKIKCDNSQEYDDLLSEDAYQQLIS